MLTTKMACSRVIEKYPWSRVVCRRVSDGRDKTHPLCRSDAVSEGRRCRKTRIQQPQTFLVNLVINERYFNNYRNIEPFKKRRSLLFVIKIQKLQFFATVQFQERAVIVLRSLFKDAIVHSAKVSSVISTGKRQETKMLNRNSDCVTRSRSSFPLDLSGRDQRLAKKHDRDRRSRTAHSSACLDYANARAHVREGIFSLAARLS